MITDSCKVVYAKNKFCCNNATFAEIFLTQYTLMLNLNNFFR